MSSVIQTQTALDALVDALGGARRIALDTEFHGERSWFPQLMLLQLRADDGPAALVDGRAGLDLRPLGPVLAATPLVVHGGAFDIALVERHTGVRPRDVFDTQIAGGFVGEGFPARLQDLAARLISIQMAKTETLSDWSRRPLTEAQIRYAELDVVVLGALADALVARMSQAHVAWCAEATTEIYDSACAPSDPGRAWLSIHGIHTLGPSERAALRAMAAWRERMAQERDVPRHTLVADSLLLDLCRRRPLTLDGFRGNRRMPSQVIKLWGEALLEAMREARASEAPPPTVPASRADLDLARAGIRAVERRTGIASDLLASDPQLASFIRGDVPAGWRGQALGAPFVAYLRGAALLRMDGTIVESAQESAQGFRLASEND